MMRTVSKSDLSTLILAAVGGLLVALLLAGCVSSECGSCGGCGPGKCPKVGKMEARVNTAGLKALIDCGTPLVILDARTGKYDDGVRIPGAGTLAPNATAEEVAGVIKSKDQLVVTYCSNPKCPASGKLAANLREQGYKHVVEYPFGIQGWVRAGNPTEKAGK